MAYQNRFYFKKVFLIARVSLIELLRERFFLLSVLLGLGVIGFSLVLGQMTINEYDRILSDFGFAAVELSAVALGSFLGAFLISKEVDRQTCLLVLARPVSRLQFIFGKLLSVVWLNSISIFILLALIFGLIGKGEYLTNSLLVGLSIWCKSMLVLLVTVLVAQLIQPAVSCFVGISIYLVGHWIPDLQYFAKKSSSDLFQSFAKALDWMVPNFYQFNWKSHYFLGHGAMVTEIGWMFIHVLAWALLLTVMINISFRRRDIV